MAMLDYRRKDQKDNVRANPFWFQSAIMNFDGREGNIMDDNQSVIISFPTLEGLANPVLIHEAVVDIKTAFVGGTVTLNVGNGTLATDNVTDGGAVTVVNATSIMASAVVIPGATGLKKGLPGLLLVKADATVPVIYLALTSTAAITAGKIQVNLLVSEIM